MKKWESAQICGLELNATENGLLDVGVETFILFNDYAERKECKQKDDEDPDPDTDENS